jgi:hypothetical protein
MYCILIIIVGNNYVWAAESAWGMAGSPLSHAGFVWLWWEAVSVVPDMVSLSAASWLLGTRWWAPERPPTVVFPSSMEAPSCWLVELSCC